MNKAYFFAIVFGILSFSFKNIGYVFQKKGVNEIIALSASLKKKAKIADYVKNKIWCIGILLPFLGGVFLAFGYACGPVSLIMPFTGVGLIVLVFFVKFYLKEKITIIEGISIVINIIGIILINLKGSAIRESYTTMLSLLDRFFTLQGIIFLLFPACILIILCVWSIKHNNRHSGSFFALLAGIIGGSGLLFQKPFALGLKLLSREHSIVICFIIVSCGGVFISLSIFAVFLLNYAYKYGRGILVAPLYSLFQMLFPILGGVIMFNEWRYLDQEGIIYQVAGICLIIIGTGLLLYYNEKKII
ncbi:MAG: hypothetical protein JXJ04_01115 [Spirochaetales bacterium]|nr:hypothetical protein [Spirochaetales bacterium]